MAKLKFSVKITDPPQIIEQRIRDVIVDKINIASKIAVKRIKPKLHELLRNGIYNSPEVKSLFGGELQAELGPEDSAVKSTIDFIVQQLIDTIDIDIKPFASFGGSMRGSITISLFPTNLIDNVIAFSASTYNTRKGVKIPWAEWLLTLGDKIIVRSYTVDFLHTRGSRTGLATMVKSKRRGWRVPTQYSGTRNNNFISRALDDVVLFLNVLLEEEFIKAL